MDNKDYGFGGWGIVILIALFFLLFAGRGVGGSGESAPATQADVQRATDFAALERQNNEGVAATRQGAYDVTGAIKDNAYNILGELRDLQSVTESSFLHTFFWQDRKKYARGATVAVSPQKRHCGAIAGVSRACGAAGGQSRPPLRKVGNAPNFIRQIFNGRTRNDTHGVSCVQETRFYGRPKGVP